MINVLLNGKKYITKGGQSIEDLLIDNNIDNYQYFGALVNGKEKELLHCLSEDDKIELFDITTKKGREIYRRTLNFIIYNAFINLKKKYNLQFNISFQKNKDGQYEIETSDGDLVKFFDLEIDIEGTNFSLTSIFYQEILDYLKSTKRFKRKEKIENPYKEFVKKEHNIEEIHLYESNYYPQNFVGYTLGNIAPNPFYVKDFVLDIDKKNKIIKILIPKKDNPSSIE